MKVLGWLAVVACTAYAASLPVTDSKATAVGRSKRWEPPEEKYFRESKRNIHYDKRFTREILSNDDQRDAIKLLVKTYLNTFRQLGIQTWLMHGSLLGWWWGKKVMPWDLDADVQVTEKDMYFLAAYYNMTTYYYRGDELPDGRTYLLDVNPHHEHREMDDVLNVIDARWIDTKTGLFIDITSARYALDHPQGEGILYDKHEHEFRDTYLYPLLETTFEGAPVKIPFGYKKMLESEYGEKALTNTRFHGHYFDDDEMQWIAVEP